MELEMENQEEGEKPTTKRRSSILKMPKARNPFEDIDTTETYTDINLSKPVRRVSFASSNFIKPFVADPEKNTIWDTTYEEDINHTNSTQSQSSQEHILNGGTKLGFTLFDSVTSKVSNMTNRFECDMELTKSVSFIDKENIPVCPSKKISIIDYAKKLSSNAVVPLFDLPSNTSHDDLNTTKLYPRYMEFTCQNFDPVIKAADNYWNREYGCHVPDGTILQEMDVELSEISICEEVRSKKLENKENQYETVMNDTCQIPQGHLTTTKEIGLNFAQINDMEFTCKVPDKNLSKTNDPTCEGHLTKTNEMEFTCQMLTQTNATQLICQIPRETLRNMNDTCQIPQGHSTKTNEMEFTCQMPPHNLTKTNEMEFTCQMLSNNVTQTNASELICQSPQRKLRKLNDTCQIPQGHSTKTNEMEFTCQMPPHNLTQTNDMEFTCQVPDKSLRKTNDPTCEGRLTKPNEMEFTCQMLTQTNATELICQKKLRKINDTCQMSPKNLTQANDMEVTCQVPHKTNETCQVEQGNLMMCQIPLTSDASMEMTCQIPFRGNLSNDKCQIPVKVNDRRTPTSTFLNPDLLQISTNTNITETKFVGNVNNVDFTNNNLSKMTLVQNINNSEMSTVDVKVTSQVSIVKDDKSLEASYSDMEVDKTLVTESGQITQNLNFENVARSQKNSTLKDKMSNSKIQTTHNKENDTTSLVEYVGAKTPQTSFHCQNITKSQISLSNTENSKTVDPKSDTPLNDLKRTPDPVNRTKNTDGVSRQASKLTPKSAEVSHIPIRTKVAVVSPPDRSRTKRAESELKKNTNIAKTLFQHKSPNLSTFKHDLSQKTPESSFHINFTNVSSGIDDTQHLLQCTYSKPIPSKFEEKYITNVSLNLQESVPNLTNLEETTDPVENVDSPDISLQRNKLSSVNDTYVLKNKIPEKVETDDDDSSCGLLSPNITVDGDLLDADNKCTKTFALQEFDYKIRRMSEISDLLDNIETQRAQITDFLENFKVRPIHIPENFTIPEKSSSYNAEGSEEVSVAWPSLEEKIRKHQESCQNCWKLEMVDGDFYHFSTLFGSLVLVVQFDLESGKVINLETRNKLAGHAEPIARYIMRFFLDKLSDNHMKCAIGDHYDVLSLLDYVQMTMLRIYSFLKEFKTCGLTMEEDFVAKYSICSVPLGLSCEIFVNVADLENCEKDIRITTNVGVINETEIKKFVKTCPKGLDFFISFSQNIREYLGVKEKRKRFAKSNL